MTTSHCFLCDVKTIFERTESFTEIKGKKVCNACVESLATSVLPSTKKPVPIQVDIKEQATIEIGSWDKCEFHFHKQRLVCTTCNTLLCVLCVPLHSTHTFSSIEDLIVEMVPKLHNLEYLSRFAFQEAKEQKSEIEEIINKLLRFFSRLQKKSSSYIYSKCREKILKFSETLRSLVLNFQGKDLAKVVAGLKYPRKVQERPLVLHWIQWNSKYVYLYDKDFRCRKEEVKDYTIPHFSRSIIVPDGIVVCGGRVDADSKGLHRATFISLPGLQVKQLPDMHFGRANHCMIYFEDYVYVIGGCDHDNKYTNRVERFSLEANIWEILSSTNRTRDSSTGVVHENEKSIYLFGGRYGGSLVSRSCEKFLIEKNIWVTLELNLTFQSMVLGSVRFSEHEVLVFAGQNEVSQQMKKCNVVNLQTLNVREVQEFTEGGCIVNEPIFVDGLVACLVFKGAADRGIHFWRPGSEMWDGKEMND